MQHTKTPAPFLHSLPHHHLIASTAQRYAMGKLKLKLALQVNNIDECMYTWHCNHNEKSKRRDVPCMWLSLLLLFGYFFCTAIPTLPFSKCFFFLHLLFVYSNLAKHRKQNHACLCKLKHSGGSSGKQLNAQKWSWNDSWLNKLWFNCTH